MEKYLKIYNIKKSILPEKLCGKEFPEMIDYMIYAKNLEFEQEPDYNYLTKLFDKMLKRVNNININEELFISPKKVKKHKCIGELSPVRLKYGSIKVGNLDSEAPPLCTLPNSNIKIENNNNYIENNSLKNRIKKRRQKLSKFNKDLNTIIANFNMNIDDDIDSLNNKVNIHSNININLKEDLKKSINNDKNDNNIINNKKNVIEINSNINNNFNLLKNKNSNLLPMNKLLVKESNLIKIKNNIQKLLKKNKNNKNLKNNN